MSMHYLVPGTPVLDRSAVTPRVMAACADCGQVRPIIARRLCRTWCYDRNRRAGTLGRYPTGLAVRLEEYAGLRAAHWGVLEICAALGISLRTARRYDARLRESGTLALWRT